MKIASYGHAAMHALQPMQIDLSKSTIPSGRTNIADVGHAVAHGASSHWLQRVTWNARRACGNIPTSTYFTYVRVTPTGTSFSDLHATVQAWQPTQRVWSMTFAHFGGRAAPASASPTAWAAGRGMPLLLG